MTLIQRQGKRPAIFNSTSDDLLLFPRVFSQVNRPQEVGMVNATSIQNGVVKPVIAALAKWHQTLVESLQIPWASPLTVALKRATNDLAAVTVPALGHASANPYKAVSKRLLELHSKGAAFPSEEEANDLRELLRHCGIATAAFGVFTGQDRALKHLEVRLGHALDVQTARLGTSQQTDKQSSASMPVRRGGRLRDDRKRQLINEAMDKGISAVKKIQVYVADKLKTGEENVSRKMISEVRKARQAKGL